MEEIPFPDRPRLRYIDERFRPDLLNLSKRYTLVILTHFAFALTFAIRSNECIRKSDDDDEVHRSYQMAAWFFIAYFLVQIPAGVISYKYSATKLFGICILGCSITSFMTPILVGWYKPAIDINAFLQGIFQGAANPAFYSIWRYWAPPLERSTLITLGYSGTFIGVVIGFQMSVAFCSVFTWEKILYLYGIMGILWYLLWVWLVFEHPNQHPTISDMEYIYLRQTIDINNDKPPIPWRQIFTTMPVWALFFGSFCRSWSFLEYQHSTYSQVSQYKHIGLGLHIEFFNLLMGVSLPLSGFAADLILKKTSISLTKLRKIYICGGLLVSVFITTGTVSFIENRVLMNFMYAVFLVIYCITLAGFYANHLDVATRYAGITISIANTLSTVSTALPLEIGYEIFPGVNKMIFYVISIAIAHLIGTIFYGCFGSGEQQSWAKSKLVEEEQESAENLTFGNELIGEDTILE